MMWKEYWLTYSLFFSRLVMIPLADRLTFHTGAGAFATKIKNTPGPTECVLRYSAAIRYLRSPALQ